MRALPTRVHPLKSILLLLSGALLLWIPGPNTPLQADWAGETRLVLYAIGNWKGDFLPDPSGRGGLPALHSLVQLERTLVEKEGGTVLLLNAGDLTGAKTTREFHTRIHPGNINLLRYMRFGAVALSSVENAAFAMGGAGDNAGLPVLSTNAIKPGPGLAPALLVPVMGQTVFFGAVTSAAGQDYDMRPDRLSVALKTARGADVFVWLAEEASLPVVMKQWTAPENPYDALSEKERIARQTIVFAAGAAKSRSYRTENGVYVCVIAGRSACRFDLRFRDHALISLQQSFINVNGKDEAASWVSPDRALLEALKTPPARTEPATGKGTRVNRTAKR